MGSAQSVEKRTRQTAEIALFRDLATETVERMPLGFVALDHERRVTYANHAAVVMTGVSLDSLVGRRPWDLFPQVVGAEAQTIRPSAPITIEYEEQIGPGRHWVGVFACPIQTGTAVFLRDISVPTGATETVRRSVAFTQGLLDPQRDAFMLCSALRDEMDAIVDFSVDFANGVAGAFLRAEPDALMGALTSAMTPDWAANLGVPSFLDVCREVVESGEAWVDEAVEFAVPGSRGAGPRGMLSIQIARFNDGFFATWRDVTDSTRQAREHELLGAVVEQSTDGVVLLDVDGVIQYANGAFLAVSGLRLENVVGRQAGEVALTMTGRRTFAAFEQAAEAEMPWRQEIELRGPEGTIRELDVGMTPLRDATARLTGYVVTVREVPERNGLSRERDRMVSAIEQSFDGILITDPAWRIVYANAAAASVTGHGPTDLVGRPITEVAATDWDPAKVADAMDAARDGRPWTGEVDRRGPEGPPLRVEVRINPTRDETGTISSWIWVVRDVTTRHQAQAALEASEGRLRTILDTMLEGVALLSAVLDKQGRIVDFRVDYANYAVGLISGTPGGRQVGRTLLELLPAHRANGLFDAYVRVVETGVPYESGAFHYLDPDAAGGPLDQIVEHRAAKMGDGYVLSVRDITQHYLAELELRRLSMAIEQTADSVVITDASGAIQYVNPAFTQVSGYSREEVLGRNPRMLQSGVQGPAFYASMWEALTSGQSYVADITNRRKDGSLYQEESVVSPVLDDAGKTTSYVAVKRDVTRERALEAAQQRLARERALVATALSALHVQSTPAATAEAICRQVLGLGRFSSASLAYFTLEGPVLALAFLRADGAPVPIRRLPFQRSRVLRERAGAGPWVETWVNRPWHPYARLHAELETAALAYVPVRSGGRLIGLLTVSSEYDDAVERLTETLPALLEFAGFAGALVGPTIDDLTEVGHAAKRIALIIRTAAFRPVFQPIVELASGAHVGYEALTRFTDGTAPDLVFADARSAGLEAELELATLAAAISAARGLPTGAWLSLNLSPGVLMASRRLAGVLRKADRRVVVEVTEHAAVADYAALRAAIGKIRPRVRVAVDDAGSGVANFGHIVELRPAFVKLDIGLVRGIDTDLTRRALMVGLLHFAAESSSMTIAEGVETEEEFAMLVALGVPLAQGYLLGRPGSVTEWTDQIAIGVTSTPPNRAAARRQTNALARADATATRVKNEAMRDRVSADREAGTWTRDPGTRVRDSVADARDDVAASRDALADARDDIAAGRDRAADTRDHLATSRDAIANSRDDVAAERDRIARDPGAAPDQKPDNASRGRRRRARG